MMYIANTLTIVNIGVVMSKFNDSNEDYSYDELFDDIVYGLDSHINYDQNIELLDWYNNILTIEESALKCKEEGDAKQGQQYLWEAYWVKLQIWFYLITKYLIRYDLNNVSEFLDQAHILGDKLKELGAKDESIISAAQNVNPVTTLDIKIAGSIWLLQDGEDTFTSDFSQSE